MEFRWIEWNIAHIGGHGVTPAEAEEVVGGASPPFPELIGNERYLVRGRTSGGRMLQVIHLLDEDGTVFVIYGRPLTRREKKRYRRRTRR